MKLEPRYEVQAHWFPELLRFAYLNRYWIRRGYIAINYGYGMSLHKEGFSP